MIKEQELQLLHVMEYKNYVQGMKDETHSRMI